MYVRDTLTHPAKGLSPSAHPFFSSLLEALYRECGVCETVWAIPP